MLNVAPLRFHKDRDAACSHQVVITKRRVIAASLEGKRLVMEAKSLTCISKRLCFNNHTRILAADKSCSSSFISVAHPARSLPVLQPPFEGFLLFVSIFLHTSNVTMPSSPHPVNCFVDGIIAGSAIHP